MENVLNLFLNYLSTSARGCILFSFQTALLFLTSYLAWELFSLHTYKLYIDISISKAKPNGFDLRGNLSTPLP